MKKRKIGLIYDTSFLMLRECTVNLTFSFKDGRSTHDHFVIERIIPEEVIDEIAGHFKDSDKEKPARHARKVVAQLIQEGALEIRLADLQLQRLAPSKLGADSDTDRALIAYALRRLRDQSWCAAFIATDDGGIMYDVVKLHQQGAAIFCVSKDGDAHSSQRPAQAFLAAEVKKPMPRSK